MRVAAPIAALGRRSERRATRAVVLAITSRIVLILGLGAGIAVAAGALHTAHPVMSSEPLVPDASSVGSGPGAEIGRSITEVLRALEAIAAAPGVELVAVEIGRDEARRAPVMLTYDVPAHADAMVGILEAIEVAGVDGPFPRTVTPVPTGMRADIAGEVLLSVARLPSDEDRDVPLAIALADEVDRAGVALRRLAVEQHGERMVDLEVEGFAVGTLSLLARIERHHAAPVRFASVESRRTESGGRRLVLRFRPRRDS